MITVKQNKKTVQGNRKKKTIDSINSVQSSLKSCHQWVSLCLNKICWVNIVGGAFQF